MSAASVSQPRSSRPGGASAGQRRPRAASSANASAAARVRWDRVGRIAMLCVGAALAYLYLSAGIHMFSTWRQARSDNATVAAMQHEHVLLLRQHELLGRRETMEEEARRLGLMKKGEQSYIVSGLPNN